MKIFFGTTLEYLTSTHGHFFFFKQCRVGVRYSNRATQLCSGVVIGSLNVVSNSEVVSVVFAVVYVVLEVCLAV